MVLINRIVTVNRMLPINTMFKNTMGWINRSILTQILI